MSGPSVEEMRQVLAEGPDAPGCASPERIWEAVRGNLPRREVLALLDHSIRCGSCMADWQLAREMGAAAGPSAAPHPAAVLHLPRRPAIWAVSALAAAAAVLLLPWARRQREPESGWRGAEAELRSAVPGDRLPRERFVLRWAPVAEARYSVVLATRDLKVVRTASGLRDPELVVPPEALAGVPAGAELAWTVIAVLPGGRRITSAAHLVRLE